MPQTCLKVADQNEKPRITVRLLGFVVKPPQKESARLIPGFYFYDPTKNSSYVLSI
jgi:hypothetical protein